MALLTFEELPANVAAIVREVTAFIGIDTDEPDLFIGDHTHEELSEGAYSIAFEGGPYDWPIAFTEALYTGKATVPAGWYLEPGASWYLAAYPES